MGEAGSLTDNGSGESGEKGMVGGEKYIVRKGLERGSGGVKGEVRGKEEGRWTMRKEAVRVSTAVKMVMGRIRFKVRVMIDIGRHDAG